MLYVAWEWGQIHVIKDLYFQPQKIKVKTPVCVEFNKNSAISVF
jgi:hypothetical protein